MIIKSFVIQSTDISVIKPKKFRNSEKTLERDIQFYKHRHRLDHSRYNILEGEANGTEKENEGREGNEGKEEEEDNGKEERTRSVCKCREVSNCHKTNTM